MVVGDELPRSRIHTLTPGPKYLSESWLTCVWFVWLRKKKQLVGGWTNPFEKICSSKWVHLPPIFGGEHQKNTWKTTTQTSWMLMSTWLGEKTADVTGKLSSHWIKFRRKHLLGGLESRLPGFESAFWSTIKKLGESSPFWGVFLSKRHQVKCHKRDAGATPRCFWLPRLRPVAATVDLLAAKILGFLESWTPNIARVFWEHFKSTRMLHSASHLGQRTKEANSNKKKCAVDLQLILPESKARKRRVHQRLPIRNVAQDEFLVPFFVHQNL